VAWRNSKAINNEGVSIISTNRRNFLLQMKNFNGPIVEKKELILP
jgi:hypothetical protein